MEIYFYSKCDCEICIEIIKLSGLIVLLFVCIRIRLRIRILFYEFSNDKWNVLSFGEMNVKGKRLGFY